MGGGDITSGKRKSREIPKRVARQQQEDIHASLEDQEQGYTRWPEMILNWLPKRRPREVRRKRVKVNEMLGGFHSLASSEQYHPIRKTDLSRVTAIKKRKLKGKRSARREWNLLKRLMAVCDEAEVHGWDKKERQESKKKRDDGIHGRIHGRQHVM